MTVYRPDRRIRRIDATALLPPSDHPRTNEFDVQLVTGLVTEGARESDVRREALRPSSLRGGMRYWYRALAGSLNLNLREEERTLFGGVERSSLFSVEVVRKGVERERLQMTVPSDLRRERYGAAPSPGSTFRVILRFRSRCTERQRDAILKTWRVFALLGGDGLRKRRARGSFAILEAPWMCTPDRLAGAANVYRDAIDGARCAIAAARTAGVAAPSTPTPKSPPPVDLPPILQPGDARLWLLAPCQADLGGELLWADVYRTIYGTLKQLPIGKPRRIAGVLKQSIGYAYGSSGGLPSPLLLSVKRATFADRSSLHFAVVLAWHHRTHARAFPSPFFGDHDVPWKHLDGKLATIPGYRAVSVL